MSVFSETIKQEIKKSQKTLLCLADASGLSLDHISKMRLGKRLPKDEDKVKKLIAALECSDDTAHELFSLYKKAQLGENEWDCIEELKQIFEFQNEKKQSQDSYLIIKDEELQSKCVLKNGGEIWLFLLQVMKSRYQCKGDRESEVYMLTGELSKPVIDILSSCLHQNKFWCKHYFSLRRNVDTEASLYNIRYINGIMPLIYTGDHYVPYYDYVQKETELLMNWIVGTEWALGMDAKMESGIVIWDADQVTYIRNSIQRKCEKRRRLLKWHSNAMEWIDDMCQYRNRAKAERPPVLHKEVNVNYYMEPSPCMLFLMPQEMLRKHLLGNEEEKEMLLFSLEKRIQQILSEKMVHFFTMEGVMRLLEDGRISGVPDWMYQPISFQARKDLLEKYMEWMKSHGNEYYVIDSSQLKLSPDVSVYSNGVLLNHDISLCLSVQKNLYCIINEMGLSDKICHFMKVMQSGEFVHSNEAGEAKLKLILEQM